MNYKNLQIIGTSHIARESIEKVKTFILEEKPDIIALELDKLRLSSLLNKRQKSVRFKDLKKIGVTGLFFNLIGAWIEKKLGKLVDTKPGSEMLIALKLAKKHTIKVALIDQDIRITLQRLSKQITWKEKFKFLFDFLIGSFHKKSKIEFDLSKVPEKKAIKKLTLEFKKRYPTLYQVLVVERNNVMAKNLNNLMYKNKEEKILAIVGAGHKEEIINIIKNARKQIV
ncbi:TraB/GumN family protein [archaeon]|nr:TraB/GumN family protein [archaeon]